jgi:hypothetical protein
MNKVLLLAFVLSGCAHPMGHFTVVADRNINDLDSISSPAGQSKTRVSGESCRDYILFIPISSRRDVDVATQEALQKTPEANGLKDVTLSSDGLFTLFYNEQCYVVEGTPIKLGK